MSRDLKDQVIAITGASSGIGAATALACARAGMHVVLGARRTDRLDTIAAQIRQLGRQALAVRCDVNRDDDVIAFVQATLDRFGRIDAIFANAGYGLYARVLDTTDAQMRAIFETNFFGTLRCIHAAVPHMVRQGHGHVVICSSGMSELGLPMYAGYAATKASQKMVADALRAELTDTGVQVTSVHPVGTSTEFSDSVHRAANDGSFSLNTPKKLMQTPEQVADAIVRCLRRPRPQVWPSPLSKLGLNIVTSIPRLTAYVLRRIYRTRLQRTAP